MFDYREYQRWMKSALKTLESARIELESGIDTYNWICFKIHQAVEKALKAILWGVGKPVIGHMLPKLLEKIGEELGVTIPDDVREAVITINKYYIPTRYPDVWTEGIPEEYYSRREAINALRLAEKVVSWVEDLWRRLLERGEGS